MKTLKTETQPLAQDVKFTEFEPIVSLVDVRVLSLSILWFPSLANANKQQLENLMLLGEGDGIRWPDLDEDLSVKGFLLGVR